MAKYSISGEFDAGWRSYWPPEPDEQSSDESAESDTAADSQSKPNESMSDAYDAADSSGDWDGDLPVYATDPDQGEITTEGTPKTDLEREEDEVRELLAEAGWSDLLTDMQVEAVAAYRLPVSDSPDAVDGHVEAGRTTVRRAIHGFMSAMAAGDREHRELFGELSQTAKNATVEVARHPGKTRAEQASAADCSDQFVTVVANTYTPLIEWMRETGVPDSSASVSDGGGSSVDASPDAGTDGGADGGTDDAAVVDVAFKLDRDVYHVLGDDGEVCCNYADGRDDLEGRTLIRTVEADVADDLDRCQRCSQSMRTDGFTRKGLANEIHRALGTGREAQTFTKDELLQILDVLEEAGVAG